MKIEFYGAAECVTGSSHLLTINNKKVLLDCGLYQGKDEKERGNEIFSFNPKEIDYVILSHAHIDHSGRIPLLYKQGFKGQVICTEATMDLCSAMLPDSGHIQEMEVEWKNRKRERRGLDLLEPLYTSEMAVMTMYLFKGNSYDKWIQLFDGFKVRFRDAGHLLGSAIVEMIIKEENKEEVKIVYSGDLGNKNIPLIKDPTQIDYADYVIMESTYGNRLHQSIDSEFDQFIKIIKQTFKRGGNVIIPSFAVGRTQEVLYALDKYVENDELKDIKVYVDSPLASVSTKIFKKHSDYFDEEASQLLEKGINPLDFEGLVFTQSTEDSINLNKVQSGAIVISASGMCEAGRIKHHLKHNLWRNECSIVFVGYQAEGTLGRIIVDGAKTVKLFGEEVAVNAQIHVLQGLSGHADRSGLIEWLEGFKNKPKEVLLVHGDNEAQQSFKELIKSKGYNSRIAHQGEKYYINESVKPVYSNKENVSVRDKIIKLLDSLDDVDNLNKELLLKEISTVISEEVKQ